MCRQMYLSPLLKYCQPCPRAYTMERSYTSGPHDCKPIWTEGLCTSIPVHTSRFMHSASAFTVLQIRCPIPACDLLSTQGAILPIIPLPGGSSSLNRSEFCVLF